MCSQIATGHMDRHMCSETRIHQHFGSEIKKSSVIEILLFGVHALVYTYLGSTCHVYDEHT